MNSNKFEFEFLGKTVTIEVGRVARQANGSALVRCGDTVILVTAVVSKEAREGIDFFPLTVDYQEKFYAAGRIPGGFFKREARPSGKATLTARLIDRPVRPLFPEGFRNDLHIVATTLSVDGENEPDVWALVGASCALQVSDIPFLGPLAAVRVGRVDGEWIFNPSPKLQEVSDFLGCVKHCFHVCNLSSWYHCMAITRKCKSLTQVLNEYTVLHRASAPHFPI